MEWSAAERNDFVFISSEWYLQYAESGVIKSLCVIYFLGNAKNGLKTALKGLNVKRYGKGPCGLSMGLYERNSGVFLRGLASTKNTVFIIRYAKPVKYVIKYDINFREIMRYAESNREQIRLD